MVDDVRLDLSLFGCKHAQSCRWTGSETVLTRSGVVAGDDFEAPAAAAAASCC